MYKMKTMTETNSHQDSQCKHYISIDFLFITTEMNVCQWAILDKYSFLHPFFFLI